MIVLVLPNFSVKRMLMKRISKVLIGFKHIARYSVNASDSFEFKTNLTFEEQSKILHILNGSGKDELSRFNIPQTHIKKIENWKNKKGSFRTLAEVLEVDGFGQRILEKICDNIIQDNSAAVNLKRNNGLNRRLKQLVTPSVPTSMLNDCETVVGVYLSPMGMSWAKMRKEDNSLSNWGYKNFFSLPKKMLPSDIFNLAVSSLRKLPSGDIYILESMSNTSPANQKQDGIVTHSQQVELASMLIALLNTSMKHNMSLIATDKADSSQMTIENRVFFLKSKVPARLFKTLVGNEKVSAITKVTGLIENDNTHEVPCSPVIVDEHLKQAFMTQSPASKELLSQALMLVVSFMDLCVRKTSASLASLAPQRATKN